VTSSISSTSPLRPRRPATAGIRVRRVGVKQNTPRAGQRVRLQWPEMNNGGVPIRRPQRSSGDNLGPSRSSSRVNPAVKARNVGPVRAHPLARLSTHSRFWVSTADNPVGRVAHDHGARDEMRRGGAGVVWAPRHALMVRLIDQHPRDNCPNPPPVTTAPNGRQPPKIPCHESKTSAIGPRSKGEGAGPRARPGPQQRANAVAEKPVAECRPRS